MSTLKTNQMTHLGNSGSANVVLLADGSATTNNDLTIGDALSVTGNTIVTGTTTLNNTLTVANNTTLNGGTNTIAGAVTLSGSNVSIVADHIDMDTGGLHTLLRPTARELEHVNTTTPSRLWYVDGDIWYQVS